MLTKMSREELINKVKDLEDEIETLHSELREEYAKGKDLKDKIYFMQNDIWKLYDKYREE
jgi:uncharacterized coiled-coil DUF342 family protein